MFRKKKIPQTKLFAIKISAKQYSQKGLALFLICINENLLKNCDIL